MAPAILIATWESGLFRVDGKSVQPEIADRPVCGLTGDGRGGALAIVDAHSLFRRSPDGEWREIARGEDTLSCCVAAGEDIYAGTDDARVLRLQEDGTLHPLPGFDAVEGRDSWYAGAALVDGKLLGPPLGIRSIAASCDGAVLLANVHVGGIPRSADGGRSWRPTIDIDSDVHEVRTHPSRPGIAIAAAAKGLCSSSDGGATWTIEDRGLLAPHCSAVAFGRHDVFVSASLDPFAERGALYRRPVDGDGPLQPLGGGMPEWTEGKVDTGCIAARDATVAAVDWAGNLYLSGDDGVSWSWSSAGLRGAGGIFLC